MSCYSCGSSFGLFKKEQGCKNCGYSFCKDCLSKKAAIPKLNNERHKVCLKCYKILSGQVQPNISTKQYSPPEVYKKRMAKLENPSPSQPELKIQNTGPSARVPQQWKNMSKEDVIIAQRLQNLKESTEKKPVPSQKDMEQRLENLKKDPKAPPVPTGQEMAERLAKLKGQTPNNINKPHVFAAERRPQTQQVDDLLQEICDEVEIDSHGLDYTADVQNRLDQFRGNLDLDKPGDFQNNLNTPNTKDQFTYIKNIPQVDNKFASASGENVDWSDMNRLINQVAGEMELDAHKAIAGLQKDNELWDRLNKLKQKKKCNVRRSSQGERSRESSTSGTPRENSTAGTPRENSTAGTPRASVSGDDEDDEEEACKKIIKQLLEESRLQDSLEEEELISGTMKQAPVPRGEGSGSFKSRKSKMNQDPETLIESDPDELPWCCICNNDACMRCMGCDGDLYCKRCYSEGHDREDYIDHQTKPFKPPAKKKH